MKDSGRFSGGGAANQAQTNTEAGRAEVRLLTIGPEQAGQRIDNFLLKVCKGVPKSHVLVIHAGWEGRDRLEERLVKELGTGAAADPSAARKIQPPGRTSTAAPCHSMRPPLGVSAAAESTTRRSSGSGAKQSRRSRRVARTRRAACTRSEEHTS